MKIPKPPAALVELFDAVLARTPGERELLFGCPSGFLGGNLFCGLFGSAMFVRLGEEDRAALLKLDGASVFDPMGGRPMKEYVVLPPEIAEDEREAARWAQRAADYAAALPAKTKAKKAARPKAP
jgi:TfoX/Sxy family transcriptional regulator of competence genes